MAYTPTGVISMCNVPFSTDRAHTRYFTTEQEQTTYFSSRVINTSLNYTFLRKDNIIRVPYNIEQIRNCNYVYYINQNFGNKIFYNFVTQVEYINENTTALHIQQDDFQTWMFNIRFLESFVEREHTNDDTKYNRDNIIEEDFNFTNYIQNKTKSINFYGTHVPAIIVVSVGTFVELPESTEPTYETGVFTYINDTRIPLYFTIFDNDTLLENILYLSGFLNNFDKYGKTDSIVSVFLYPKDNISATITYFDETRYKYPTIARVQINPFIYSADIVEDIDGYIPKNNKLYNYPFTYLSLETPDNSAMYKYEYFNSELPQFKYFVSLYENPKYLIYPYNYCIKTPVGGVTGKEKIYDGITGNIGCNIPYSKDQASVEYALNKNYYETNKANAKRDFITHLATGIADVATTNFMATPMAGAALLSGGLGGAVSSLGTSLISSERAVTDTINTAISDDNKRRLIEAKIKDVSNLPTILVGNSGDTLTLVQYSNFVFMFQQQCITKEVAERVDNYLSVYGYKTNKFKIPNLTGRARWNYVKTSGINIVPNTSGIIPPSTDIENIKNIFNNGITLWHDNNIMDYGDFSNDIIA